jgi:hypothetical protein
METFEIPGFNQYKITKCGKVYSYYSNKFLNEILSNRGYYYVWLCNNGVSTKFYIHRLVAKVFLDIPFNDKYVINHKNGNKLDNRVENLEWCSIQDNVLHYYKYLDKFNNSSWKGESAVGLSNGRPPRKQSNINNRVLLNKDEYEHIYSLCEKKIPVRFIYRKFQNIDEGHIKAVYNFINGKKVHRMSV